MQRQAAVQTARLVPAGSEGAAQGEGPVLMANVAAVAHVPSQMELAADPADIAMIRELYGSRAQALIDALCAFDAYFAWYYPFKKSVPSGCDMETRNARALENAQLAIDMHEAFERVSSRGHGSYLPHAAIYKVTRDILEVGDVWAYGVSPLELQNAETKRVASALGARNITFGRNGTTMALSTLRNLLAAQHLRRGDGIISLRSRRGERLFGSEGIGRLTLPAKLKLECDVEYDPRSDTCVKAFIRLLAAHASADANSP